MTAIDNRLYCVLNEMRVMGPIILYLTSHSPSSSSSSSSYSSAVVLVLLSVTLTRLCTTHGSQANVRPARLTVIHSLIMHYINRVICGSLISQPGQLRVWPPPPPRNPNPDLATATQLNLSAQPFAVDRRSCARDSPYVHL